MDLNILWFILIGTLFVVYFFLDGMDFGIGMLLPFLGKKDADNKKMIHAIGPTWGANEVWVLTAGGAMFASFPGWYATLFSGFYPALFLLLLAMIVRGISLEFRGKAISDFGKKGFNTLIFIGNLLTPLLFSVALACLLRGTPINEEFEFTGSLFSLFSPFTLLVGLTAVSFFLFHGAAYLKLKLPAGTIETKGIASKAGIVTIVLLCLTMIAAYFETNIFDKVGSTIFAVVTLLLLVGAYISLLKEKGKLQFLLNGLVVASSIITLFTAMFPRVMVSSTNINNSLTIYNVSSSDYTLKVITIVTLTLLPIVLGYTIWSYWLFAQKKTEEIDY